MKEQTTKLGAALFTLAILLVVILIAFVVAGFLHADDFIKLGQWGDFFGGTLNPILTATTVLVLLYTVYLQRQANDLQKEELVLTREELSRSADALENQIKTLEKQNFEATFFKMLEMHNSILNSIDVNKRGVLVKGRDCFAHFSDLIRERFIEAGGSSSSNDDVEQLNILVAVNTKFWKIVLGELGHYYRYLYRLIRYVEEFNGDKHFYMKIVRAQLSDHELSLLFYNCLSEHGTKMRKLVETYALPKHMQDEALFLDKERHKNDAFISLSAFGEKAT
ncbi:MAG: putative phage abortive infection protein [Rhodospirillales bacterium]|nr:putative phage abortive infection protein [Rhodospirillales bacterium]